MELIEKILKELAFSKGEIVDLLDAEKEDSRSEILSAWSARYNEVILDKPEVKDKFKKEWEGKLGKETGYKESDTRHQNRIEYLQKELERIKERRSKQPKEKKESTREIPDDEKAILDEIEKEQTIWDAEKDAARQFANDYGKMETERNRQLKRVGELNKQIDTLRKGELPEGKKLEPKIDTPEIEALKAEKDALESSVRASIAHAKKMKDLEAELQRLKDRKAKEPKERIIQFWAYAPQKYVDLVGGKLKAGSIASKLFCEVVKARLN